MPRSAEATHRADRTAPRATRNTQGQPPHHAGGSITP